MLDFHGLTMPYETAQALRRGDIVSVPLKTYLRAVDQDDVLMGNEEALPFVTVPFMPSPTPGILICAGCLLCSESARAGLIAPAVREAIRCERRRVRRLRRQRRGAR